MVIYLCAGVGTSEEDARGLTGEGTGSTGIAEGAETLDNVLDGTLLAEAGVGDGRKGGKDD